MLNLFITPIACAVNQHADRRSFQFAPPTVAPPHPPTVAAATFTRGATRVVGGKGVGGVATFP